MPGPSEFRRRLAVLREKIQRNAEVAVRRAAITIDRELVISTPVDTGRARSNWLASVGSPRSEVVGPRDPASAVAEATAVVSRFRLGDQVYITNNVPYIRRLNEGSSAQAPAGFVERAVDAGRQELRGFALLK